MATFNNVAKLSLKYTATVASNESQSRTISGFNIGGGDVTGTARMVGINSMISTLRSFSTATLGNWRWVQENEVIE